jgi:hypothetical protein
MVCGQNRIITAVRIDIGDFMKVDDIFVSWNIQTFDRKLKGPFPPPHRHYMLDWTKASENEQAEIIKILGISDTDHEQEFRGMGTQSKTWSVGAHKSDKRMFKFRHMFVEKSLEEIEKLTSGEHFRVYNHVNLNREYYEDETGREISMREMMQIATGNNNIIPFDAENIVQLGPCPIYARETWTADKANTIFNFIQVVRLIWNSSWARKKTSITTHFNNKEQAKITCDFPEVESMCAVLTLFRQLYACEDLLMKKTCEIYMEHSSNTIKKQWVDHCLKNFEQRLNRNPDFIPLQGCTVKQLFNAFLYGTGLVHSPKDRNRNNRNRLSGLVGQHSREKVIMAVNDSFWMALEYAVDVFHVIKQDYEYWTKKEGCAKADMFDIYSLMRSQGA